ncbi:molybdopterin-dependent oxidoreductase [Novipirellula artificiosorum]|uniref:Nitrate reductase n=1 Tax=Novipirellula artificiosorum TaxID=2528016 RepID=A0A5C6DRL3_9BACT|nr:molybdopterin-dependent oxidoreductase [Novipirellula artificiosorum]TWU37389.1 Periplasmic nitrate reductase precursor [Novipirellula artificiosorum]
MDTQRRRFLKSAAMAAAGSMVAANTDLISLPVMGADDTLPDGDGLTWSKAPCRFCGTGCHVQVGVEDGRIVAVAGDKHADVNKGLLCVKGYHVGGILYGEDRLTKPLLRKDGELVEIEWDEAIDIIAKRINKAPDRFAFYGSGQWTIPEGYAAQKLMKGGLSNNHIDPNARLCMASAVTGFLATYGVDEPAGCYADLDACNVLITWGNNPAEMHPVLFSRVTDRRSRGEEVKIIDISTRRTRTSDAANEYLEMKPHGDVAISLGIMHLLIENDSYDKAFVKNHCNFRGDEADTPTLTGEAISEEEFRKRIAKYTPEHVEELSGVPAEKIRMLADLFGNRDHLITSLWCMGMNQHTMGTAINSLVHGVHLLSGHFGRPGDAPTSLTGQPSACGTVREVGTLAHALPGGRVVAKPEHRSQCEGFWNLPEGRINPVPGYHTVKMFDQFTKPTAEGGDIDTLFVQVTNPGQTLPNLNKLFNDKQGMEDKFLIVSDVYPTATTQLADLILPAALWVEKNGIFGNSERRTQQWFKLVDPPGEARDDTWMTIAIAHRLFELGHEGMKDKDGDFLFAVKDDEGNEIPIWEFEHYYDVNVDKHLFEEYRPFTTMKHKNLAPYDEYVKARGMRWPVVEQSDGSWRETKFRFSGFDDPFVAEGKEFDFYHSNTEDGKAQIWFHEYQSPPEMPDKDFPYWLCTGRVLEHWHTGTMTRRVTQLNRAMPTSYVEMNMEDARDQNIRQGETVILESRRGTTELPVWIDGRGRPPRGTVFVPFFDETKLINNCTLDAHDPFSKQPDYKKCSVRVRKINDATPSQVAKSD